ncbi:NTP transferase domain-containing protein [Pseudomonadota bacterium]
MKNPESAKLAAVLLAAGASERLGQPKQLVRLDGQSLVRQAAGLLSTLGLETVVVTGHRSEDVARELDGLPVTAVYNSEWRLGMGGSIACGVKHIPGQPDGVMLVLCDQWRVDQSDFRALVSAWKSDISRIAAAQWDHESEVISGPPVIFPRNLMHELKFLDPASGAKAVIDGHKDVTYVSLKNAAYDLDSPEDLEVLSRGKEFYFR